MDSRIDTSGYDRVIALDTQMIFEARPLTQLDWSAISAGPILLVVLSQVSAEVDARKRDGRLGQRARDLNRRLELSIEGGGATTLAEQPVRIDIAYVAAGRVDWDYLDDLERDNGDDRIVAQAKHALVDDPARVEVMSFDSRPRAAARRHGMKAIKPNEGAVSLIATRLCLAQLSPENAASAHERLPLGQGGLAAVSEGLSIDEVTFGSEVVVEVGVDRSELL